VWWGLPSLHPNHSTWDGHHQLPHASSPQRRDDQRSGYSRCPKRAPIETRQWPLSALPTSRSDNINRYLIRPNKNKIPTRPTNDARAVPIHSPHQKAIHLGRNTSPHPGSSLDILPANNSNRRRSYNHIRTFVCCPSLHLVAVDRM